MTDPHDLGAMVDQQFKLLQDLRATPEGFTVNNLRRVVQPVYDALPRNTWREVQYPRDLQGTETGTHLKELIAYVRLEDTGYEFGVRALNILQGVGARYVGKVAAMPREEIRLLKGFGNKSFHQVERFLGTLGFEFGTDLGLTYPNSTGEQ